MSVHRRGKSWETRWRDEAGKNRSRAFKRKRDADEWDDEKTRQRQRGHLGPVDAADQTLTAYVIEEWSRDHLPYVTEGTRKDYVRAYDRYIEPTFGDLALHAIRPKLIKRWQIDVQNENGPEALAKARTVLSSILRAAVEEEYLIANPVGSVRAPKKPMRKRVCPLAPASVEALRAELDHRDAVLVSVLAYAGLRPGEMRRLRWRDVQERTLVIDATKTNTRRTVRLLEPLAHDLREWRMASGRPADHLPVIPRPSDGGIMSASTFGTWVTKKFHPAVARAGVDLARPYDLRHAFASLLANEGLPDAYVAEQLGHSPMELQRTYKHVLQELAGQPKVSAEDAIRAVRTSVFASGSHLERRAS